MYVIVLSPSVCVCVLCLYLYGEVRTYVPQLLCVSEFLSLCVHVYLQVCSDKLYPKLPVHMLYAESFTSYVHTYCTYVYVCVRMYLCACFIMSFSLFLVSCCSLRASASLSRSRLTCCRNSWQLSRRSLRLQWLACKKSWP